MPRGSQLLSRVRDEVDSRTGGWSGYSTTRKWFSDFTYPKATFREYVAEKFEPAQRLWRSASSSSLSFDTELRDNFGSLRRSNSYTSLAPSHGMDFTDRYVPRYVNSYHVYKCKSDSWQRENALISRQKAFDAQMKQRTKLRDRRSIPFHTPPTFRTQREYPDYMSILPARTPRALITRPVSMTRPQYDSFRFSHKLLGIRTATPFLYPNYDLDDDRRMHRIHWGAREQTSRYGSTTASELVRKQPSAVTAYRNRRSLLVY